MLTRLFIYTRIMKPLPWTRRKLHDIWHNLVNLRFRNQCILITDEKGFVHNRTNRFRTGWIPLHPRTINMTREPYSWILITPCVLAVRVSFLSSISHSSACVTCVHYGRYPQTKSRINKCENMSLRHLTISKAQRVNTKRHTKRHTQRPANHKFPQTQKFSFDIWDLQDICNRMRAWLTCDCVWMCSGNRVGPKGAISLAKGLTSNSTLTSLDLGCEWWMQIDRLWWGVIEAISGRMWRDVMLWLFIGCYNHST